MTKQLSKIKFYGGIWYVDYVLSEIRNVFNPHDKISFQDINNLWMEVISHEV